jgi:hypothetical protein
MSRKRTVRRVWKMVNPIEHAIAGASITPSERLDKLRLLELTAIESFARGRATADDWRTVADMLNVAETMARGNVGPEVLPVCECVQVELADAHARYQRGGALGFTGAGLRAVRDVYEYHDLQRQSVSRSEYEAAIKRTADRIRGASGDIKVCIA